MDKFIHLFQFLLLFIGGSVLMALSAEPPNMWEELGVDEFALHAKPVTSAAACGNLEPGTGVFHQKRSADEVGGVGATSRKNRRVFSSFARTKRAALRHAADVLLDVADRIPFEGVKSKSEKVSHESPHPAK